MSVLNRYCFITEHFDQLAGIVRTYQLYFYPDDNSIELHDIKNKKIFLKKVVYQGVSEKDLFIGSDLTIYSRKYKIVEYGDNYTRKKFEEAATSTFAMIKPNAYLHMGKIISMIYENGFRIAKLKMTQLTPSEAAEFYAEHKGKAFFDNLIKFMTSDVIVAMELIKNDAIKEWRSLIGPTNPDIARRDAPGSIRALFGDDGTKNAVHGSDSSASASREVNFFFGSGTRLRSQPRMNNCSCLVIKPHCITEGNAGKIVDAVLSEAFEISAMEMFYLDKITAEEFFEVYKGVLPEYAAIIEHVTTGPVIAIEVRQDDVVNKLRALVGPHDPEIGKQLRPKTLRALFGLDRVKNALHCTDLPDDGVLEVQYFFELLN